MGEDIRKIRDGFEGEKLISIPAFILARMVNEMPPGQLYITHIGYFPKARYHYRERKKGCRDNILFYCIQGKGYYLFNGKKTELKAGQYVLLPATENPLSYWADREDPWTIYWVHFTGEEIGKFNQAVLPEKSPESLYIPYNEEGLNIWNRIYEILSLGYDARQLIHANLCLPHLIATFMYASVHPAQKLERKEQDYMEEAIKYMQAHPDKKLSVEEIAARYGFSASHFSKLFRLSTGMPPIDYFIHLKMRKACQLLCTTDLPVKEIAYRVGYDDPYYFSRLFKKIHKQSPVAYRISVNRLF